MIEVTNTIKIYKSSKEISSDKISICSHWNDNKRVVIFLPDGNEIELIASDLQQAIVNAINSNKF